MTAPTGLARVTISTPRRRVDVALPEYLPVAELLPDLLRHAGDGLADDGEPHGGWLLRRTDGQPLAGALGLHAQGVRDGEILHLVPAREDWPELEYDDAVEAIAAGARRTGPGWSPRASRVAGLGAAGVPLAAGLVALAGSPSWTVAGLTGLGVAALLTLAALAATKGYRDRPVGAVLAGYALPYAALGGALLAARSGPDLSGAGPHWLGAPQVALGGAGLLLCAGLGAAAGRAAPRLFAAAGTLGLLGVAGGLLGLALPAAGAGAVLLALLVCGVGVLPLVAIRLGRLPVPGRPFAAPAPTDPAAPGPGPSGPAVPGPSVAVPGPSVAAVPDQAAVFSAVRRTEALLSGALTGYAVATVLTVPPLLAGGGTGGRLLVLAGSVSLLLRSRLFGAVRQRVPLLAAGLAGLLGVAVVGAAGAGARAPVLVAVLVAGALAVLAAAVGYAVRPPSPYLARAADLLDVALVVAVVPLACAVLGLYGRVRNLGS